MIGEPFVEAFPSVDLSHRDLARGEQRPEQHRRRLRRRQDGLRLDPSLELFVQALDQSGTVALNESATNYDPASIQVVLAPSGVVFNTSTFTNDAKGSSEIMTAN